MAGVKKLRPLPPPWRKLHISGWPTSSLPKACWCHWPSRWMINRLVEWVHTVHKHLDKEFIRLNQQHIAAEEALILLSEEVIIMYTQIFAVCCQ